MVVTTPLTATLTFLPASEWNPAEATSTGRKPLLDWSCSTATCTVLRSWGSFGSRSSTPGDENERTRNGLIMGCDDGTLYLFHRRHRSKDLPEVQISGLSQQSSSRSQQSLHGSQSRGRTSASNSSAAPIKVSPRARVVSGVTAEKVEAPKNYVDFDEQPEKLKGLLMGKSTRDSRTSLSDSGALARDGSQTTSPNDVGSIASRRSGSKSLLSPPQSNKPFPTPESGSHPFPQDFSFDVALRAHIVLPLSRVERRSVTDILVLDGMGVVVVLLDSGDIYLLRQEDGSCLASITAEAKIDHAETSNDVWKWSKLSFHYIGESLVLAAAAAVDTKESDSVFLGLDDSGQLEKAQMALFDLFLDHKVTSMEASLRKLAQWTFNGSIHTSGIYQTPQGVSLFYKVVEEVHIVVQPIHLGGKLTPHYSGEPPASIPGTSLPIPNALKSMMSDSNTPPAEPPTTGDSFVLEGEQELGVLPLTSRPIGFVFYRYLDRSYALSWNGTQLIVLDVRDGSLGVIVDQAIQPSSKATWVCDGVYAVYSASQAQWTCYSIWGSEPNVPRPALSKPISTDSAAYISCRSTADIIVTKVSHDGIRQLTWYSESEGHLTDRLLWSASGRSKSVPYLTALLPLDFGLIISGFSDGYLRQFLLPQMSSRLHTPQKFSDSPLNGYITTLQSIQNLRTKVNYIVGGADDGSVAIWTADTLQICARWTIFTTPLNIAIQFPMEKVGSLKGCIFCVAEDGTIAVIALDGFQYLYLIPGSIAPLTRICLDGENNNLMVVYANRTARLWNVKSRELWRSMSLPKAEEMLTQWGWMEMQIENYPTAPKSIWRTVSPRPLGIDTVSTLQMDIEPFIIEANEMAKIISTSKEQSRAILLTIERLKWLLSTLVTSGLNDEIDSIMHSKMGIQRATISVGMYQDNVNVIYQCGNLADQWSVSPEVTAARMVLVVAVLRVLGLFSEYTESAAKLVTFYSNLPQNAQLPTFRRPSFVYLAKQWLLSSNELRPAIKVVIDSIITNMTDEQASELTEDWHHQLPVFQHASEADSLSAALALSICGYIATARYSILSTGLLTDVSKSVVRYLQERPVYRLLAIDLCSRGFQVWQHYIDTIAIMHELFTLATGTRKDTISTQNVAAQARQAVLQIAASHTVLFITTLGLDMISPTSVEHQASVLQIVAYLIRKRPHVLQPNIPKLVEVVVKSLDPNSTTFREALLDTATEIIGHIVNRYPSVDFHGPTQRLAVGTEEGAVIMYDLKTATRLYVLEGHKKGASACCFSPDGRRLISVSLEEGTALVWKVGTSFVSFFNPGAPPRQGHSGSDPFKTYKFNFGDAVNIADAASAFDAIQFEWSDRNLKLKIGEGAMSFPV